MLYSDIATCQSKMEAFVDFIQKRYKTAERICTAQSGSVGGSKEFWKGFDIFIPV